MGIYRGFKEVSARVGKCYSWLFLVIPGSDPLKPPYKPGLTRERDLTRVNTQYTP